MYYQYKLILHQHPIRMLQNFMSYKREFNLYTLLVQSYFTHTSNNIPTHHVLFLKTNDVSHSLNKVATHY
jgi:hypothetical protein